VPKQRGPSPTVVNTVMKTLVTIPENCGGKLFLSNIGSAGTIYYKHGCDDTETVSPTDYEDKLAVNEWRWIDDPEPGRVLTICSIDPTGVNFTWHASWRKL